MPHPVDFHVGQRVKELRNIRGLTQSDVAKSLGFSFQQLQKYETGSNRISASRLYELARHLKVTSSYFFEGLEGENNQSLPPIDAETVRIASTLSQITDQRLKGQINMFLNEIVRAVPTSKDDQ